MICLIYYRYKLFSGFGKRENCILLHDLLFFYSFKNKVGDKIKKIFKFCCYSKYQFIQAIKIDLIVTYFGYTGEYLCVKCIFLSYLSQLA